MLSQYDFDKIFSLGIFEDITFNRPNIPAFTHTVFNFDHVYSHSIDKLRDFNIDFSESMNISNEISKLNPNQFVHVFQFHNYELRKRIIQLSYDGYRLFNEALYKNVSNAYLRRGAGPATYDTVINSATLRFRYEPINLNLRYCYIAIVNDTRSWCTSNICNLPQDYRLSLSSMNQFDQLRCIKTAFERRLTLLRYLDRNHKSKQFIKSYNEKRTQYLERTKNRRIDNNHKLYVARNQIQQIAFKHPEYTQLEWLLSNMTNVSLNLYNRLVHNYWCDYNHDDFTFMSNFMNSYESLLPTEFYKPEVKCSTHLGEELLKLFDHLDLPQYQDPEYQTLRNEIYRLDFECRKIGEPTPDMLKDVLDLFKHNFNLISHYEPMYQYIADSMVDRIAELLSNVVANHYPPKPSTIEEKLEKALRERDEITSKYSELQKQLDDLQAELNRERESNTMLQDKLDQANACIETERQNTITMRNAYNEELDKNQLVTKKLIDIQSILARWSELMTE